MSRASSPTSTMTGSGGQGPLVKRRRGRQPRPCTLTAPVREAARQFARSVGSPRVIEPAGFRDFVGWLQYLNSPAAAEPWNRLIHAVLADCNGSMEHVARIQPDVVREIIANVITIRAGESSKLISTNARRQSTRPDQGMTLMKIFDNAVSAARHGRSTGQRRVASTLRREPVRSAPVKQRSSSTARVTSSSRPPMAAPSRRHASHTVKLPSMQELEASLRRK